MFPVCLAMAIACGVNLRSGIYSAVIAGVLTSVFGASKIQISAPSLLALTAASAIVRGGSVRSLSLSIMLVGALLVLLAVTGLGAAFRFIPRGVVLGLSTGVGILIIAGSVPNLLGVTARSTLVHPVAAISLPAAILAIATVVLITTCRKTSARIPAGLIAMATGALVVKLWHIPVQTIGAHPLLASLTLHPSFIRLANLDLPGGVLAQAFAIAVLIGIESARTGELATSLTGEQHNPRADLLIHGAANIACSFAGGLPASGSYRYTSVNLDGGAQTPVAGILQSIFQLALVFLAVPFAGSIPVPTLAAILLSSVLAMRHWRDLSGLLKLSEASACLATSLLTIAADLPTAVAGGMLITIALRIPRQGAPA
jgi:sulfate permease, SulP family